MASSSGRSFPLVADKLPKKGLELGIGMLRAGGPSIGRKLLLFDDFDIGEGGTRKLAEDGVEGVPSAGVPGLSLSVDALLGNRVTLGCAEDGGDEIGKEDVL